MKHISYNLDSKIINRPLYSKYHLSLGEQQILDLQDIFLSPGMHSITVGSKQEGQSLIYTFLNALRCYKTIGYIASDYIPKDCLDMLNILGFLKITNFTTSNIVVAERFLAEDFDLDFLWIDYNQKDPWSYYFEHKIQELGIDQQIPIILIQSS